MSLFQEHQSGEWKTDDAIKQSVEGHIESNKQACGSDKRFKSRNTMIDVTIEQSMRRNREQTINKRKSA